MAGCILEDEATMAAEVRYREYELGRYATMTVVGQRRCPICPGELCTRVGAQGRRQWVDGGCKGETVDVSVKL